MESASQQLIDPLHQHPPAFCLPLDPVLSSLSQPHQQPPTTTTNTTTTTTTTTATTTTATAVAATPAHPKRPRLPKSKLVQCAQLDQAAQQALDGVWESLQVANQSNHQLKISRNLDRQFGELHASAAPFKQDALALIWPQCINNKALKASFNSRRSPAYFAIRRANIAFVAEYVLYAMPGEEAYGKNDIVFACEGFLPLVLDPELVLEPQSWKLFNELKVQIYIQRLDQSGQEEADSRVLPNLFVESLSSYSGLDVPPHSEVEFDKLATETKQELVAAQANLELLQTNHPYNKFAIWALEFLHRCASRLDQEAQQYEQLLLSAPSSSREPKASSSSSSRLKRPRQTETNGPPPPPPSPLLAPPALLPSTGPTPHSPQPQSFANPPVDINVAPNSTSDEEYTLEGEPGSKGYNPYRLGRGKGPTSAPRRRWTQEEYDLLLEEVRLHSNKYDCMAQIMKRHGRGGEISETLKDQNNVSLKDKARNLTMEWQRHGYPQDKPWLREAFARFSVKNMKRYRQRAGGGGTSEAGMEDGDSEEEQSQGREPGPSVGMEGSGGQTAGGARRAKKKTRTAPPSSSQPGFHSNAPLFDSLPAPDIGVVPVIAFPVIDGFENAHFDLADHLPDDHHSAPELHLDPLPPLPSLDTDHHPLFARHTPHHHHLLPDSLCTEQHQQTPLELQEQQHRSDNTLCSRPPRPDPAQPHLPTATPASGSLPQHSPSLPSSSSPLAPQIHPLLALPSSPGPSSSSAAAAPGPASASSAAPAPAAASATVTAATVAATAAEPVTGAATATGSAAAAMSATHEDLDHDALRAFLDAFKAAAAASSPACPPPPHSSSSTAAAAAPVTGPGPARPSFPPSPPPSTRTTTTTMESADATLAPLPLVVDPSLL
ncbi:hypothetical protein PCANC_15427 [Puccinia coronata f. sp. avenae]|uniref:Myb-like domain-containing protein n=1 Tax=Puccinia coronata f. sp. avenae TaxID=200324 RepID=A0A2N5SWK0_9BASI|nr:hypothetical protein PCANC_15427 [Puccinia coronata f. sp. avenae]PLW32877.1 hypothetical protein PCASD_20848 [Puccinia coronata f. sp. avenae]